MRNLEPESQKLAVFSPPFTNLFTYSNDIADMGNTRDHAEFYLQFEFFLKELRPSNDARQNNMLPPFTVSRY